MRICFETLFGKRGGNFRDFAFAGAEYFRHNYLANAFFLARWCFWGIGLLILVGKQYYLVAGIPIRSGSYSEIPERKGRVAGGVTLGLGVLLLVLGFVNL